MSRDDGDVPARRRLLSSGVALLGGAFILGSSARGVEAKEYASRLQALDELDRLASVCGMRVGTVGRSRADAGLLASRLLAALKSHRAGRDDVRRRFGLPRGVDPASLLGTVGDDLTGLRQALDDLMVAYAESLPVFGDAGVVSRLAVDMVEVSKLRTVIDLWVEAGAP